MKNTQQKRILITGGCGYIGSVLVPKLARNHEVIVLDSMLFGNHVPKTKNITFVSGDIRDNKLMSSLMSRATDVIHLASIANDPSSDLDPAVTYTVNRDAVVQIVEAAKKLGVRRFINASSSSVYGVKEEESVTEDLTLEPITLYAKLKAETEKVVSNANSDKFTTISIRSATVCGPSPRMRFDVIVNIMAKAAILNGVITVFGGNQYRPNIHVDDLSDLYALLIEMPDDKISGKIYNVGSTNYTVMEIAQMAREEIGAVIKVDNNNLDNRSYRISSEKIKRELGFVPKKTIRQAIVDIKKAFDAGMFSNPDDSRYYNVRTVKENMAKSG